MCCIHNTGNKYRYDIDILNVIERKLQHFIYVVFRIILIDNVGTGQLL